MGCGADGTEAVEHYIVCLDVLAIARRHLLFNLGAVRDAGPAAVLGRMGTPGERGLRPTLHLDAALAAHNRVRHRLGGTGLQAFAARLTEGARRFLASRAHASAVRGGPPQGLWVRRRSARDWAATGAAPRSLLCSWVG